MCSLSRKAFLPVLLVLLVFCMTSPVSAETLPAANDTAAAKAFTDVDAQDPNVIFINYLSQRGLVSGFPDGSFRPEQGLTRAEGAALMLRASGLKADSGKTSFKDVPVSHWANSSIAAAATAGLLKGYPDGSFHPEEKLTRAQGISLIMRLSQQTGNASLPVLTDMDANHWAAKPVAEALASGMIGLTSDAKNFLPDQAMSRSELARALGVLLTSDPDLYAAGLIATLNVTKGNVTLNKNGSKETTTVKSFVKVTSGDLITTGSDGSAELVFEDGSGLLLEENTTISIKETRGRSYIENNGKPGTAVDFLNINLVKGNIFGALATNSESDNTAATSNEKKTSQLKNLNNVLLAGLDNGLSGLLAAAAPSKAAPWYEAKDTKKVKVKVDMPYGVAAIRGTFWQNMVSANGQSSTSVLVGDAEVINQGQTVPLQAGQVSQITSATQPPAPPAPMSNAELSSWVQVAAWAQQRAESIQNNQPATIAPPPAASSVPGALPVQPQLPVVQTPVQPPSVLQVITSAIVEAAQTSGTSLPSGFNPNPAATATNPVTTPTVTPSTGGSSTGTSDSETSTRRVIISPLSSLSMDSSTTRTITIITNPIDAALISAVSNNSCVEVLNVNQEGRSFDLHAVSQGTATITVTAAKSTYRNGVTSFTVNVDLATATPTATPPAGSIASGTEICLQTTTSGASIYYTLDGTTPSAANGTLYSESNKPVIIFTTGVTSVTLKAIAIKEALADSTVLTQTYTMGSATLSALTLSSGTLTPAFSPYVTSYTATVDNSVTSITVTPTASAGTITVNELTVVSGQASGPINLNPGTNLIVVSVSEPNKLASNYTITVTRATTSSAKDITAFSFQGLSPAVVGTINETARTICLTVPEDTNLTNLVATFTVSAGATVKIGTTTQISGTTVNDFTNPVTYIVTAADATTKQYFVTVNKGSAGPTGTWTTAPTYAGAMTSEFGVSVSNLTGPTHFELWSTSGTGNIIGVRKLITGETVRTVSMALGDPSILQVKFFASADATTPVATATVGGSAGATSGSLTITLPVQPTGTWSVALTYAGAMTSEFGVSVSNLTGPTHFELWSTSGTGNIIGVRKLITGETVRTVSMALGDPSILQVKFFTSVDATTPVARATVCGSAGATSGSLTITLP